MYRIVSRGLCPGDAGGASGVGAERLPSAADASGRRRGAGKVPAKNWQATAAKRRMISACRLRISTARTFRAGAAPRPSRNIATPRRRAHRLSSAGSATPVTPERIPNNAAKVKQIVRGTARRRAGEDAPEQALRGSDRVQAASRRPK
jgi:hypothetical protein